MNSSDEAQAQDNPHLGDDSDPEMIKVVDRKGNVKIIPRSEYEAKKRRRKRQDSSSRNLPVKEIFSVIIILAAILAVSYIALHLVR